MGRGGGRGRSGRRGGGGGRGAGGGRGGYGGGGGGGGRGFSAPQFDAYSRGLGYSHDNGPSPFSMRDEARNTESHTKHWGFSGTPLRHAGINFVSAGAMDPQVLLEPREPQPEANSGQSSTPTEAEEMEVTFDLPEAEAEAAPVQVERIEALVAVPLVENQPTAIGVEQAPTPATQEVNVNVTMLEEMDINRLEVNTSIQTTNPEPSEDMPFVVDVCITKGNKPRLELDPQLLTQTEALRPTSPALVSSGEEIVFVPRKQRKTKLFTASSMPTSKPVSRPRSPRQSSARAASPLLKDTFFSTARPVTVVDDPIHITSHTIIHTGSNQDTQTSKSGKRKEARKARKEKRAKKYSRGTKDDFDDDVVADYIANTNMEELEEFVKGAGRRDVGGDNMDVWQSVSEDDDEGDDDDDDDDDDGDNDGWDEANLEDFDAISTSDEGKGRVHKILRKRHRPSGIQYLIKWEGASTDDATWILAESLDSAAEKLIKKFEKRELLREILAQLSEDSDEKEDEEGEDDDDQDEDEDDEDDDEDEDDEDEEEEDEEDEDDDQDLRNKKAQEEADFKLARILAGMEESDELDDLGAFGGFIDDDDEDDEDDEDFFLHKTSGKIGFGIRPKNGKYPSASRMANALADEWSPMDWATPSNVAPKKKGKKDKARRTQWDMSDEELELQIRSQWENDRNAKKGKKAEREALRMEGLLGMGGRPGKKDMKARYIDGMNMAQLHQEIHDFLMSDHASLALPPMGKAARKSVHNVAFSLNLESKSHGSGKNRFPILFKNRRTEVFIGNSELIMRQLGRSEKRFLPRGDQTARKVRKVGGRGGGGFEGNHRDGDMVGGHAPEIGLDNKGRRMLEKMGYKAGMGLGAEGNKGIMAPIIAVVKTSRAGLG